MNKLLIISGLILCSACQPNLTNLVARASATDSAMSWVCNEYDNKERVYIKCSFTNHSSNEAQACIDLNFYSNISGNLVAHGHTPVCSGTLDSNDQVTKYKYFDKNQLTPACGPALQGCNMLAEKIK
jgi:hypothetical protein